MLVFQTSIIYDFLNLLSLRQDKNHKQGYSSSYVIKRIIVTTSQNTIAWKNQSILWCTGPPGQPSAPPPLRAPPRGSGPRPGGSLPPLLVPPFSRHAFHATLYAPSFPRRAFRARLFAPGFSRQAFRTTLFVPRFSRHPFPNIISHNLHVSDLVSHESNSGVYISSPSPHPLRLERVGLKKHTDSSVAL